VFSNGHYSNISWFNLDLCFHRKPLFCVQMCKLSVILQNNIHQVISKQQQPITYESLFNILSHLTDLVQHGDTRWLSIVPIRYSTCVLCHLSVCVQVPVWWRQVSFCCRSYFESLRVLKRAIKLNLTVMHCSTSGLSVPLTYAMIYCGIYHYLEWHESYFKVYISRP